MPHLRPLLLCWLVGCVAPGGAARIGAVPVLARLDTAAWIAEGDQAGADLGDAVTSAGDVDGDGYGDLAVGVSGWDGGQTDEGAVRVYLGSAAGPSLAPDWTVEADQAAADLGSAVAAAGDVNGDGYGDLLVGAPLFDAGQANEGAAFVYLGSAGGLAASPAWTAQADRANARLGRSVASAGDVNGDGYGDVVVGAPQWANGQADEGRVLVYLGSAAGLGAAPAFTVESDQAGAQLGRSVAGVGDVDGDGYDDVLAGAFGWDGGQADEGAAFLYRGSANGLLPGAAWSAEPDQAGARFGFTVAAAGDVDGDGFADVAVGAYLWDGAATDEGAAFVYLGSANGLGAAPAWTAEGGQAGAHQGFGLASAGDVDGDGFGDLLTGPDELDDVGVDEGEVQLWSGSASGLADLPTWTTRGEQAGALLGWAVAAAGDVDGDGHGDVIASARTWDDGELDEGAAFLWRGTTAGLDPDADGDGVGDEADACPGGDDRLDADADGAPNACDDPTLSAEDEPTAGGLLALVATAAPGEVVRFAAAPGVGGAGPCLPGGLCGDLGRRFVDLGAATADAGGVAHRVVPVPAIAPVGAPFVVQALVVRGAGGADSAKSPLLPLVVR